MSEELTNHSEEVTTEVTHEEQTTSTENTTQEQVTQEPQRIKVKYNHEEKEITLDEAVQLAQKGLNYDKVQEKLNALQTNPALSLVEAQAQKYGMTVPEYVEAVREAEEAEEVQKLMETDGLSEEAARRLLKLERSEAEREKQSQESRKQREQEEKVQADAMAFQKAYPDVKPDDIPQSVWDAVEKGSSLVDAYGRFENQALKAKIAELEKGREVAAANQANANASTGSVTGQGNTGKAYFTKEQVEKMSTEEVMKNYDAVIESRKLWK